MKSIFKSWDPDPTGLLLGTGFMRFTTGIGIDGLALEYSDSIDILAVYSNIEGRGNFRKFMSELKRHYNQVRVLHIMEPIVAKALKNYGFLEVTAIMPDGEKVEGLEWNKEVRTRAQA